jgi:uncharacterized membrane protein YtjA (UPF0391 family)
MISTLPLHCILSLQSRGGENLEAGERKVLWQCRNCVFQKELIMLYYAAVFLVIAIIAGVLGFGGIAGASAGIAQILFFVFLVFLVLSLIAGVLRRG